MARDCPDALLPGPSGGESEQKGDKKGSITATGLGLGQTSTPQHLSQALRGSSLPSQSYKPFPGPQKLWQKPC